MTKLKTIRTKGKEIRYRIVHPYRDPINSQQDFIDIEVEFKGKKYTGSVTTTKFVDERLKYYKGSGENKSGSYFCAKGMLILRRINDITIRRTLVDLVERGDLQEFLDF